MIYTLTMNPAIDLFCQTTHLIPKIVNRTNNDDVQANGKGVNVSFILKKLGIENKAMGFSAGFTGNYIEESLQEQKIETDFVTLKSGVTRINVFVKDEEAATEYKIVNSGPEVSPEAQKELLEKIKMISKGDFLVVSGSLPQGCEPSILIEIAKICQNNHVKLVVDTSYHEVLNLLPYQPFLLKPNDEELELWFDTEIASTTELVKYGEKLIDMGAQNILLSLGEEGALYLNQTTKLLGNAPVGEVVNTACAGDTMLGTFLAYLMKEATFEVALQEAIAAGSSTAFREGLTDFSDTDELKKQIEIKNWRE